VADHLGCPLEKTIVGKEQLSLLDTLVYHYDEPIADISIIPTYLVSELASRNRKAVFSGEGADELFGGYWWQKKAANLPAWRYQLEKWTDRLSGRHPTFMVEQYAEAMSMGRFTEHNLPDLLHPDRLEALDEYADWFYAAHYRSDLAPLKAFQRLDVRSFMGELVLTQIDRASMAHSLEVRVPFLDNDLFNTVFALPPGQFFRKDITKYLLHENLKERLPQRILDRPKQGFVGPDTYYMDIPWYAEVLRDGKLVQDQIIKASAIERLVGEKKHWELWKLAVLEKWMQRWT
jgi:asparagine synthase (glutamine-hydrolysing)